MNNSFSDSKNLYSIVMASYLLSFIQKTNNTFARVNFVKAAYTKWFNENCDKLTNDFTASSEFFDLEKEILLDLEIPEADIREWQTASFNASLASGN